jgi:hypothetical protein
MFVFEYLIGLGIFGVLYHVFNLILGGMWGYGDGSSSVFLFARLFWGGAVFIYLVFGALYLWREIRIWKVFTGR